ncbi:MAG: hypothetical protein HKN79_11020, partial [Flavobacteriales bacterium]|nr:hypothetical protein [Flavobacteriales bacterium]
MYQKILFTSVLGMAFLASPAQVDLSKYSATKRTKIAEEEQIASETDQVFQTLMTQGVEFFENNEFEQAIDRFEEAGERRPLNVYPPVMIEDVRLAMDLYVEEEPQEEEVENPVEEQSKEPELTAEERVEQMYQAELAKVYKDMPPPP